MSSLLSSEELKELLEYKPRKGELRWKKRPLNYFSSPEYTKYWNKRYAGQSVGGICSINGTYGFSINHKRYQAARAIWCMMIGEYPLGNVSYLDGNPENLKWNNLSSHLAQTRNTMNGPQSYAKSGYRGVKTYEHTYKYQAVYKRISLGYYDSPEEASQAYQAYVNKMLKNEPNK